VTASLPADAREAFERFITTEYTTVGAGRQPITWPVTPYYRQGGASIDVTTGLGYPKKADDAKRHPSVALLFSDATGSGIESGIQVLVQGTAQVDDRNLEANRERYWRESWEKLPGARDAHPPKFMRSLFSWYYTRIYVHVRPERVFIWRNGDLTAEPELHDAHLEEVRSGHAEEPVEPHGRAIGGEAVWDERVDRLGAEYETGVVSWLAPDGFPLAVRLPLQVDAASRTIGLGAEPAGVPLLPGRACLSVHRHAPDFSWQQNFQVRGDLEPVEGGWRLVPRRLVGGFELPDEGMAARTLRNAGKIRRFRKTARRRMKECESEGSAAL
jgi:hypothetical protein